MKLSSITNHCWVFEMDEPQQSAQQYTGVQAQISSWLQHHNITEFTINQDNTVDVPGDVHFLSPRFKKLPFQFRHIGGDLAISNGMLQSSWGFPKQLDGSLHWSGLESAADLSHLPVHVKGDAIFDWCKTTFEKSSMRIVDGSFVVLHALLTTFKGFPTHIGGTLRVQNDRDDTAVSSLEGLPQTIGSGHLALDCLTGFTELKGIPEGITHLTLKQAAGYHAQINIAQPLHHIKHLSTELFGAIVGGLENLPTPCNSPRIKFSGESLEGAPKVINGEVYLVIDDKSQLTKGMHKHFGTINGPLSLSMALDRVGGTPLLGIFRIKGINKFVMYNSSYPKLATMINEALINGQDIFEIQEQMIDAGFKDFAKL